MAKSKKIEVEGKEITIILDNEQEYLSLTDMLKAKDGDFFISDWLRNRNTVEYLGIWESVYNPNFNYGEFAIIKSQAGLNSYKLSVKEWVEKTNAIGLKATAGRYGGTYAHPDIAFEFGMWISPQFKIYLIKEFQRLKNEENGRLKLEWNLQRTLAKVNYQIQTDAIKENLIPKEITKQQASFVYANEADLLNVALFGITAKVWRENNSDKKGNITDQISESCLISLQTKEQGYCFPLYLYPETNGQLSTALNTERIPNLNLEIVNNLAEKLGLTFVNDHEKIPEEFSMLVETKLPNEPFVRPYDWGYHNCFTPLDLLDYIYAVLHSPTYRETYKEFLKIDFPKIPYPKDQDTFWQLVNLGGDIREIHLLESPKVDDFITEFNINGDCIVGKPRFEMSPIRVQNPDRVLGNVYINETQCFENVPEVAWNFYIGGYQPAQKWLKDRKERKLEFEDIAHYQKIIVALTETDRLMKEIDKIDIES